MALVGYVSNTDSDAISCRDPSDATCEASPYMIRSWADMT
jgi:hypothetical protein